MLIIAIAVLVILLYYQRKRKLRKTLFLALLALSLAGVFAAGLSMFEKETQITYLPKNPTGSGSDEVSVYVKNDKGEREDLELTVPEKEYSHIEAKQILEQAAGEIDGLIIGDNPSLQDVRGDLNLVNEIPELGVQVSWQTNMPEVVNWDGSLGEDRTENGSEVTLTAELTLGKESLTIERRVVVYAGSLTLADLLRKEVRELNKHADDPLYYLPSEIEGKEIIWYKKSDSMGSAVLGFSIVLMLLLLYREKTKKEKEAEKRKQALKMQYPELVMKIQLFLSAGLSMRKIFERMALAYKKREKKAGKREYVYEEVYKAFREMESGKTEAEAYENFGARCEDPAYRGLSVLLVQNLRLGGQGLIALMQQEVDIALETRKRRAREQGEKATIKLLLPMSMMLIVVLVIIMVPAMMNF